MSESAGWHNDRGNELADALRLSEAIEAYRRAIEIDPDYAEAFSNLGTALRDSGEIEGAIEVYERALKLKPGLAEAWNNLAIALRDKGELELALANCRRALEINKDYADALANLGVILCDLDRGEEAVAASRRAAELQPRRAVVQNNLAMILLRTGNYEEGWGRFEWRYFCDPRYPARQMDRPRWDGSDLNGRTLLIHAEQGFGDTIQFARYVALAAECVGKVILECPAELRRLFEGLKGMKSEKGEKIELVVKGEALPAFDVHCPMMSLPAVLGGRVEGIPSGVYLRADRGRVEYWKKRLGENKAPHVHAGLRRKKIGLVWAGKPTHTDDRNRSMRLEDLAGLVQIDADFFSLQKGVATEQARRAPARMKLVDFTDEFTDYAETAAFVANMDLVIAVDTSVAHLAGAMGKKVWVMLPKAADWRWMLRREDTPWYATMRLFRQERWRDWSSVVGRIGEEFRKL